MLVVVFDEIGSDSLVSSCPGGSRPDREYLSCDRELYDALLFEDYFFKNPTFGPIKFCRRFRMRREFFLRIVESISAIDPWFVQKRDALDRLGLSTLQKCTAAIKMLAYGLPADACDDYCKLGETTISQCLKQFVVAI